MELEENESSTGGGSSPSSLMELLTNVIVSPSEAFDEIKGVAVNANNWMLPLALAILAGIVFSVTVFSQEGVIENMLAAQEAQFEKRVENGQMTEQEAEQARKGMETFMNPKLLMAVSAAASIFFTPMVWAVLAFLFHWIVRIGSKSHIPFSKCFEVIGLASVVSVLGILVNMLLVMLTGNVAMSLSLALAFENYDPTNSTHALAAEVDVMRFWYIAVLSIAWSRLTNHPVASCATWILGSWIAFRVATIVLFT